MSPFQTLDLPALSGEYDLKASGSVSKPETVQVLPVGPSCLGYTRRAVHNRTFDADDAFEADFISRHGTPVQKPEDADDYVPSEDESPALLNLDPKEWKKQDHYAVLGLSSLRYKSTPAQIKAAHRKKVLKHHPDKKSSASHDANDDSFFKCIAKAYDQLSHPIKKRQFDSVDHAIDDEDFPHKTVKPEKFFDAWGPVFAREARFNNKPQAAPMLGDMDSTKKEVEVFYDFWYNFDSWRSFEYEDDEINEGADSRDEKRYRERKNRSERQRKKTEDNARLRVIVDSAMQSDPRLKKFKQEEKAAREAKRKGKPNAVAAQKALEEQKKKEEEQKAAAEAEAKKASEDKAARESAKKSKEAAKKNLKRDKKAISSLIPTLNYFLPTGEQATPVQIEGYLTELDQIMDKCEPEDVAGLRAKAEANKADPAKVREDVASVGKSKGLELKFFA